jgi:hypothetical protein
LRFEECHGKKTRLKTPVRSPAGVSQQPGISIWRACSQYHENREKGLKRPIHPRRLQLVKELATVEAKAPCPVRQASLCVNPAGKTSLPSGEQIQPIF